MYRCARNPYYKHCQLHCERARLDRSGKRPVRAYLDGQPLGVVQGVTVRRSTVAAVELAFTREFDASGKLLRSLFPPADAED